MKKFNDLFLITENFIQQPYICIEDKKSRYLSKNIPVAVLKKEYEQEVIDTVVPEGLYKKYLTMSLQKQFDSCRYRDHFECGCLPIERLDDDFPMLSDENVKSSWTWNSSVNVHIEYVLATENDIFLGLCIQGKILWVGGEIAYKTETWSSGDNNGAGYKGEGYYTVTKYLDLIYNPSFVFFDTVFKLKENKELKTIVIPEGVRVIGDGAFEHCKVLEEVVLPESLEEIQAGAFYKCERLKKIIIPKRVKKIPYRTFAECSALEYVELSGVEKIGSFAFAECTSLKEVIFSTNEIQIESYAFVDCNSLEKLINSENIVKFEDNVFSKCLSIKKFRFGDKVTHISNNIFYGCSSLEEVYIPDSVWMIGDNAFYLCPLKRVTISERRINLLCKSFIPNREPISPETFKKVNFVLL